MHATYICYIDMHFVYNQESRNLCLFILVVCVGCSRGWHCCGMVWNRCVCHRPGWDSCYHRVSDATCHAHNAACWALKRPLDLALKAAIWVVDKSRHALDVAKGALHVARGVVYAARQSLNAANAFLEGVKRLYSVGVNAISAHARFILTQIINIRDIYFNVGLNVANAISARARFILTQIINIREIYFNVGLNVANGGRFQCRVTGTLMGQNININLDIDIRNVWSFAKSLAERALSGLSKFIG